MAFKVMGIVAGRHGGNTEVLVKEALSAVQDAGGEVVLINLFDYKILHCTGCEGCTRQMGDIAQDPTKTYKGCVLKDKDDVDRIITELHNCQGVIIGVPSYDLTPSALYMTFAQRFLAYELAFLLQVGVVKEDPHTVAGLIANGGSCHDWQTFTLESMQATMFTQSMTVVDRYMATRNGLPGNVFRHEDQIARARKMGENIVKAINTPVEEREWLGDPDDGMCPRCHSSLIYEGDQHWDGIEFPFECAVCGSGGDLVPQGNGKYKFVLAENGLIRDRNKNEARAEHLNEIMQTRVDYLAHIQEYADLKKKYKEMTFPTIPAGK